MMALLPGGIITFTILITLRFGLQQLIENATPLLNCSGLNASTLLRGSDATCALILNCAKGANGLLIYGFL